MTIDPNTELSVEPELPTNEILPVKTYVDLNVSHEPEWHGYRWKAGTGLYVGPMAGRKSIALYQVNARGEAEALAWFSSEIKAKQMLWWLDAMNQKFMSRDYQLEEYDGSEI